MDFKTDEFIKKSSILHNNFYSYEKTVYERSDIRVIITCPIHGDFEQKPLHHLQGMGCKQCSLEKRKMTKEHFIKRLINNFGNKYDYSNIPENIDKKTKITLFCKEHNKEFTLSASSLLIGRHCNLCVPTKEVTYKKFREKDTLFHTKEKFLEHIKGTSKENLIYLNIDKFPLTHNEKLLMKCKIHGEFSQTLRNFFVGKGCPKCSLDSRKLTNEDFILKAKNIHKDKYSYEKTVYLNNHKKVIITCPIHGDFEQKPSHHLQGMGCKNCTNSVSNKEREVYDFVKSVYSGEIIQNSKKILSNNEKKYELDIFIPEFNLGIEYNGNFWHSEQQKGKDYHYKKYLFSKKLGINILNIYSHEWINQKEIIKSIIKNKLNLFDKIIYARKCSVQLINKEQEKDFLEKNHLQGYINSSVCFALVFDNEIVMAMSFGEGRFEKGKLELLRLASKLNTKVIGGSNRLFKHFLDSDYFIKDLITYSNNDHFSGKIYEKLGFKFIKETNPSYYYFKIRNEDIIYSRQMFQKHKLKDKLKDFDENLTEYENMLKNGYDRVWNTGNKKFILKKE